MIHFRRTLPRVLAAPLVLLAWACQDGSAPTDLLDVPVAKSVSVDFQAGDGDQFLFLPPLANGKPSAALATGLDLSVTICDPSANCETMAAKEHDDHYQANWKSDKAQAGVAYSVAVSGSGVSLGELTLTLEKNGKDKAGSTFPIKFWVGETLGDAVAEVADCVGDDRCNAAPVPDGQETTITTLDETGKTMGEVIFPDAAVPEGGLIVTLDCREGGYDPGEGPLPTDLKQWPLFCHVDVKNPDGSAFTGTLDTDASIEICVVDEMESGQVPFHGFADNEDLRLGKSHTGSDFEFLPPGPENLSCIGTTTQTASASPVGKMFDAIGSSLAWVLSPVLPRKLYARRMFRDGGVGGLVSSFSDINPVEPAIIAGTVTYGGVGVAEVTVTLSGAAAMGTTTDGDGNYSFGPLQAAQGGGSSYTLTVSDLPAGEAFASLSQVVSVTGSGTFAANFETQLPYNPVTGNYYSAIAAPLSWPNADTAASALTFGACGGQLAAIESEDENIFITTNLPQAHDGPQGGYWIGGFQPAGSLEPAGGWQWVTGESVDYAKWAPGEPNNSGNAEHTIQFNGGWSGGVNPTSWNDEPGERPYGYVVEYECPTS